MTNITNNSYLLIIILVLFIIFKHANTKSSRSKGNYI